MLLKKLIKVSLTSLSVITLAACTTSAPRNVQGLRQVTGSSLIGSMGKTLQDQNNIDITVARNCGGNVYTPAECDRHTVASQARRKELLQ